MLCIHSLFWQDRVEWSKIDQPLYLMVLAGWGRKGRPRHVLPKGWGRAAGRHQERVLGSLGRMEGGQRGGAA